MNHGVGVSTGVTRKMRGISGGHNKSGSGTLGAVGRAAWGCIASRALPTGESAACVAATEGRVADSAIESGRLGDRVGPTMKAKTLAALALASLVLTGAEEKEPPVVTPGGTDGAPPSDAVVLFDGKDLSGWESVRGGEAKWEVADGAMVVNRSGNIRTRESFGDIQLHIEWATPSEVKGNGQGRGNSGVYLQGRYEIQVLDSWENRTYPNGQAGAFYGNNPPLVNASRKPGEWQSYDIVFIAPRPQEDGTVIPGSFTVFHNGVLIQNHIPIEGRKTTAATYSGAAVKGPLVLQDHGNPVRYRNIWLRRLTP